MSQMQCPWCHRLGPRVDDDRLLRADWAQPHADGSACVCRHVTCETRGGAQDHGGRYWDGQRWVCFGGCEATAESDPDGLSPADRRVADRIADMPLVEPAPGWEDRVLDAIRTGQP